MDVQEILSHLQRNDGHFPRDAVREAIDRREDVIPPLLEVLEDVARDPQSFASDPDRMIQIYVMFLLAQFRETRAYPLLVQIFSAPGELPFDLAGDVVTEDLGSILASVSAGDPAGMISLVKNEQANEYVRSAALEGLLTLVAQDMQNRDEIMTCLRSFFHTLERTPSQVWNGLASACADLCPEEVVEELQLAYEDELVEPGYIGCKEIERALGAGRDAAIASLKQRRPLINDVETEMGWWACFKENKRKWDPLKVRIGLAPATSLNRVTVPKTRAKVGRNEPCPCGSGKKFKKCCGR